MIGLLKQRLGTDFDPGSVVGHFGCGCVIEKLALTLRIGYFQYPVDPVGRVEN